MVQTILQCPNSGGVGVFVMRNFVELFNDTLEYDDANTCLRQGFYKQQNNTINATSGQPSFLIIPNPANNLIAIELLQPLQGFCNLMIYDAIGKSVLTKSFNCEQKNYQLDITTLTNGIYQIKLNANDATQLIQKLIVIK